MTPRSTSTDSASTNSARAARQDNTAQRLGWAIGIPAWVAVAFLAIPLLALLTRVDWPNFASDLTSPVALEALKLSAITTSITLVIVLIFGTPLAWVLARSTGRWVPLVRALMTVPLVLPRSSAAWPCSPHTGAWGCWGSRLTWPLASRSRSPRWLS
ncbi:hypothetical protein [Ornithinimicrobium sp. INDO-MA30-4]|uniref:hypothetical protein n=1 Tax=Ornithinimicrobium sp. INDO-MA30-4 TaxID=2908651 RepID=UPI0028831217|nr:hypothetical protein [Ornithinimicrobium sp. INDO-MA30-4]